MIEFAKENEIMNDSKKIYAAMAAALADVKAVGKDKRNQQQGFNYRGIDDVVDAMHSVFAKHGIFMTSNVIDSAQQERTTQRGGVLIYTRAKVEYTFWAEDGSSVSSTVQGEGMDSGDKSTNKALSAALKYCLGQTFLIPYEMADSDRDTPEVAPEAALNEAQISTIEGRLFTAGIELEKFWSWASDAAGVSSKRDIPAKLYDVLLTKIDARVAKAMAQ